MFRRDPLMAQWRAVARLLELDDAQAAPCWGWCGKPCGAAGCSAQRGETSGSC
ncbi:hypothetical protein ACXXDK_08355 [Deinococcus sp. PESE-38]